MAHFCIRYQYFFAEAKLNIKDTRHINKLFLLNPTCLSEFHKEFINFTVYPFK